MKILLYGGTFDPPHNGHMNNLRAALALVQPDRALVMPAGTPPHKHASATPAELRLQMCACFTALSPAVQVSDWEIRQGGRSYTVHTLEMLRGANPGAELYLCVGSDMLLTFGEWYRWQDMLKMAALVVESRTGTDEANNTGAVDERGKWDVHLGQTCLDIRRGLRKAITQLGRLVQVVAPRSKLVCKSLSLGNKTVANGGLRRRGGLGRWLRLKIGQSWCHRCPPVLFVQ